jgi:Uma2 family endonuclease
MGVATSLHISVEEYLSNPAFEHCEYVDGQPVELHVGHKDHARTKARCAAKLDEHFDTHPGWVGTGLHCQLTIRGEVRFRLPDVAVVLGDRFTPDGYLDGAPDLAVEVRSPGDRLAEQMRKFDDYFANGTKLGWLVLPEEKSVLILLPNAAPQTVVSGETLTGGDLLPDLAFPADYLFA